MEPNKTERTAEAAVPEAPQTPQAPKSLPVRRVGSLTLGVCLIAAGAFFLCYYFLPHFNWELALKIAPAAGLCLLGGEVLYFAAKPGRWKYDFLSVFFCLCLMAVCLCMSALPMVLDRIDPANEARVAKIAADYENTLYAAIRDEAPDIPLKDLRAGLYDYYGSAETATAAASDLNNGLGVLRVNIELFGPYEQKAAFAIDCRKITDIIRQQTAQPTGVTFFYDGIEVADSEELHTGSRKQECSYTLNLDSNAQLDWTADQMTKQTEASSLLDEENTAAEREAED